MAEATPRAGKSKPKPGILGAPLIRGLSLCGFKSHRDTRAVEVRQLTVLAGENSGGKSSLVQPLLLLKQTIEAQHDPGALELRGACVAFDRATDMFWRGVPSCEAAADAWSVGMDLGPWTYEVRYRRAEGERVSIRLAETRFTTQERQVRLTEDLTPAEAWDAMSGLVDLDVLAPGGFPPKELSEKVEFRFHPSRVGHALQFRFRGAETSPWSAGFQDVELPRWDLTRLIHLPGLRGNPERTYRVSRVQSVFPGPFPVYTASVVEEWQEAKDRRLDDLAHDLAALRLTREIGTQRVDDTRVEVLVGRRLGASSSSDRVNIADVGFGASQALPVVVALRAASRDQLVHIEQPELHLHPDAQVAMAGLLVAAARRGVRVVAETHSSVLLRALQAEIAESDDLRDLVALHWCARDPETGASKVTTAEIGSDGSLGDWPVDFADVEMRVHRRFIEAAAGKGPRKVRA